MMSDASSPSQTRLTILAKRNATTCLTIADDLRQQTKKTSILGLAIISGWSGSGGSEGQLVVLDTMVHKSQQFTQVEPIHVEFQEGYNCLYSCALITESECLVFTTLSAILISLTDQQYKYISYPHCIVKEIQHSVNLMMSTPCMIVATYKIYDVFMKNKIQEYYP